MKALELADLLADYNDLDIRRAVAMLRQQQEKLEFVESRLKLSDDAFDATERKVKGMHEDLIETRLCYYKVVEQRNDAYAEIKRLNRILGDTLNAKVSK